MRPKALAKWRERRRKGEEEEQPPLPGLQRDRQGAPETAEAKAKCHCGKGARPVLRSVEGWPPPTESGRSAPFRSLGPVTAVLAPGSAPRDQGSEREATALRPSSSLSSPASSIFSSIFSPIFSSIFSPLFTCLR